MIKDLKTVTEELRNKRNYSWIKDIFSRNMNNGDGIAINYLGREITYKEMFAEVKRFAKALKGCGVKKGEEVVVCLDRVPEFVYLMGATSLIGAKIKVISANMDIDAMKTCLEKSNSSLVFVSTSKLAKLKDVLKQFPNKNIVPVSHERSINDKCCFRKKFNEFYDFDSKKYDQALSELNNICNFDIFLWQGESYRDDAEDKVNFLDDAFTVTYTKDGKEVVRPNGYYIMRGHYLDKNEASKKLGIYAKAKVYSNLPTALESFLTLVLSNTLMQGGTLVMDPVDKQEYFAKAMELYQPMTNFATTDTWVGCATNYFKNREMTFLESSMFNVTVSPMSWGEEHLLNRYLTRVYAGVNVTGFEHSIAKISVCGYDELFGDYGRVLFRTWLNPEVSLLNNTFSRTSEGYYYELADPKGIIPHDFVDVRVMTADRKIAGTCQYGYVYCYAPWIEANHNNNFNKWVCIGYGYKDQKGAITLKDASDLNKSFIASTIDRDIKNIMSCEVITTNDNQGKEVYVAYIKPQPKRLVTDWQRRKVIDDIIERCFISLPDAIRDNLYIRFINNYPLTPDGVRDIKALEKIGLIGASHLNDLSEKKRGPKQRIKKTRNIVL